MVLEGFRKMPPDDWLQTLFEQEIEKCKALDTMMALYTQDHVHNGVPKSYERLRRMLSPL